MGLLDSSYINLTRIVPDSRGGGVNDRVQVKDVLFIVSGKGDVLRPLSCVWNCVVFIEFLQCMTKQTLIISVNMRAAQPQPVNNQFPPMVGVPLLVYS